MKLFDKSFFNKLMVEVVMRYQKHIFDPKGGGAGANDVHGRPYKGYSDSYGEAKKAGSLRGIDGTPQAGKFRNSTAPVMTGELMRSFNESAATSQGFGFGSITRKARLKFLTDMKREISTNAKPLPKKVGEYIMKQVDLHVKKEWKKLPDKKINL